MLSGKFLQNIVVLRVVRLKRLKAFDIQADSKQLAYPTPIGFKQFSLADSNCCPVKICSCLWGSAENGYLLLFLL